MSRVNRLSIRPIPTRRDFLAEISHYALVIDGRNLVDHMNDAFLGTHGIALQWPHAGDSMIHLKELERSLTGSGDFTIVIGTHCYMNGILSADDVEIAPFSVTHREGLLNWNVNFWVLYDGERRKAEVRFSFDWNQARAEIDKLKADPKNRK